MPGLCEQSGYVVTVTNGQDRERIYLPKGVTVEMVNQLLPWCDLGYLRSTVRRIQDIFERSYGGRSDSQLKYPAGNRAGAEKNIGFAKSSQTLRERLRELLADYIPSDSEIDPVVWDAIPDYLLTWCDFRLTDLVAAAQESAEFWLEERIKIDMIELRRKVLDEFVKRIEKMYPLFRAEAAVA